MSSKPVKRCMRQGRNFAFWKREVTDMLRDACASWLGDFRMDGLRFDSANDLPPQTVQAMTWAMREHFPGRILTAEARPVCWRCRAIAAFVVCCKLPAVSLDAGGGKAGFLMAARWGALPMHLFAHRGGAAQVTPENPMSVHELGFDSVWVHSGYFDIIQQHRALGRGHHGGGARPSSVHPVHSQTPCWQLALVRQAKPCCCPKQC